MTTAWRPRVNASGFAGRSEAAHCAGRQSGRNPKYLGVNGLFDGKVYQP